MGDSAKFEADLAVEIAEPPGRIPGIMSSIDIQQPLSCKRFCFLLCDSLNHNSRGAVEGRAL